MPDKLGICTNLFDCDRASNSEKLSIPVGAPFVCPDCGNELWPAQVDTTERLRKYTKRAVILGLPAIVVGALVLKFAFPSQSSTKDQADPQDPPDTTPTVEKLPSMLLTRSNARLYQEATRSSGDKILPFLQVYFINDRQNSEGDRWYAVAEHPKATSIGFLHEDDIMEWKQTIVVEFHHQANRDEVLFFRDKASLLDLVETNDRDRVDQLDDIYRTIRSGEIPTGFPIVAKEPKWVADSKRNFYVLPILEHDSSRLGTSPTKLLQVTAATRARNRRTDWWKDFEPTQLNRLKVDVVFVMDLTSSMGDYVRHAADVIRGVAREIGSTPGLAQGLRFGFWGFTDPIDYLEFEHSSPVRHEHTKNFTPTLERVEPFLETMASVKEKSGSSLGAEEDLFTGLLDAIQQTAWTPNAMRFIVLIGDAPGHDLRKHPAMDQIMNRGGFTEAGIRSLASEQSPTISIAAIHIKRPQRNQAEVWRKAADQFKALSRNVESGVEPDFFDVMADDFDGYREVIGEITGMLTDGMAKAIRGEMVSGGLFGNALVDWVPIIEHQAPPNDVTGWICENDLRDPYRGSLRVKLLITRAQLSALRQISTKILADARRASEYGVEFHNTLSTLGVALTRAPDRINKADELTKARAIYDLIKDLPYKSEVLRLTPDDWKTRPPTARLEFVRRLEEKVRFYAEMAKADEGWIKLHENANPQDDVRTIPLEQLP